MMSGRTVSLLSLLLGVLCSSCQAFTVSVPHQQLRSFGVAASRFVSPLADKSSSNLDIEALVFEASSNLDIEALVAEAVDMVAEAVDMVAEAVDVAVPVPNLETETATTTETTTTTKSSVILSGIDPILTLDEQQLERDEKYMREAIKMALAAGGEYGLESAFPNPTAGAVLVTADGRIIGKGRSDYSQDAVWAAVLDAGLEVTPLQQWCVSWPTSASLRKDLAESTLYVTLEPSADRKGTAVPPITELIQLSGIPRVVIGSPDPVEELCAKGAAELHSSSISVNTGILFDECQELIEGYSDVANNKLQRMARTHFKQFGRPLGFLHCSVVDSDNLEEFARQGNAFSTNSGGAPLSFRNLGSYAIAPPPEFIWADGSAPGDDLDTDTLIDVDFEDEDFQGGMQSGSPMMPWYEQVDAVVATFPKQGNNGAVGDNSVTGRLNGLKWLATYGEDLPAGVERILVLDATDLADLPLTNTDPNLPKGVDVEAFWAGLKRKPTRLLLRRGSNAQARAAAEAAARAAKAAAEAAQAAADAIESGDAASAAEAAIECQKAAAAATEYIQNQLQSVQTLKRKFQDKGVIVETLNGSDPLDVMKHLGERNGLHSVVWRAGCWGERGVNAIMAGAFQWVSAHLAVDAVGGRFWQLMLAENAVQAACGPAQKVKVFADQEDISLEYCDEPDVDTDCVLSVGGRPIRHVRLDCRVALVDGDRPREFMIAKTKKLDRKTIEEAAPWFL